MNIVGIHDGHNSTAALLSDGKIIACASEERFTRKKNQQGFPLFSLKWIKENYLKNANIDYVALSSYDLPTVETYLKQESLSNDYYYHRKTGIIRKNIVNFLQKTDTYELITNGINKINSFKIKENLICRKKLILSSLDISENKIIVVDHHIAHAAAAYYGSYFNTENSLVFTCDSWGDGASATISISKAGYLNTLIRVSGASLGDFYSSITAFLGMKVWEHEYKVMGLAAYAKDSDIKKPYEILKKSIRLDTQKLKFIRTVPTSFYEYFVENLVGIRFDWIAGAAQKILEELLLQWVTISVNKYGLNNVCVGGGVFMNVKVNKRIIEIPSIQNFFAFPSCGDESLAIGATYKVYFDKTNKLPEPFLNAYLGPSYSKEYIKDILDKNKDRLTYNWYKNMEVEIADLLSRGNIVARLKGRCEYGARALGNRSILSPANDASIITKLNKMIKMRDFWMPFCPAILDEDMDKYMINPKKIPAYYMIIAFDTVQKNRKDMIAATHAFDGTCRPQIVTKEINPEYYNLIKEYKKKTKCGVILNTSFNLHGDPMVNSPEDALNTLFNSGLNYLALDNFLIKKLEPGF